MDERIIYKLWPIPRRYILHKQRNNTSGIYTGTARCASLSSSRSPAHSTLFHTYTHVTIVYVYQANSVCLDLCWLGVKETGSFYLSFLTLKVCHVNLPAPLPMVQWQQQTRLSHGPLLVMLHLPVKTHLYSWMDHMPSAVMPKARPCFGQRVTQRV